MRVWHTLAVVGALSFAAGCYPDESADSEHELKGLVLALGDAGVRLTEPAFESWLGWLEGEPLLAPFDLGQPGNEFALGLRLHSLVLLDEQVSFLGRTIQLVEGPPQELVLDLAISDCPQCYFEVVVFWRERDSLPPVIHTYVGDNAAAPFDVPSAAGADGTTIELAETGKGRVEILAGTRPPEAGARLAALDLGENVRFPAVVPQVGAVPLASLDQLPVGRELAIEYDPIGDDRFYSSLGTVLLEQAGQVERLNLP